MKILVDRKLLEEIRDSLIESIEDEGGFEPDWSKDNREFVTKINAALSEPQGETPKPKIYYTYIVQQISGEGINVPAVLKEDYDALERRLRAANERIKELEPWKLAIDRQLLTFEMVVESYTDPSKALQDIIEWNVMVATDEKVNGGYRLVKVDAANERNKELEQDARRYQKLKEKLRYEKDDGGMAVMTLDWFVEVWSMAPESIDAAIDAEIDK